MKVRTPIFDASFVSFSFSVARGKGGIPVLVTLTLDRGKFANPVSPLTGPPENPVGN